MNHNIRGKIIQSLLSNCRRLEIEWNEHKFARDPTKDDEGISLFLERLSSTIVRMVTNIGATG